MKTGKFLKNAFRLFAISSLIGFFPILMMTFISFEHCIHDNPLDASMINKIIIGTVNNKFCAIMMFVGSFSTLFFLMFTILTVMRYSFIFTRIDEYDSMKDNILSKEEELDKLIKKYNQKLSKEE